MKTRKIFLLFNAVIVIISMITGSFATAAPKTVLAAGQEPGTRTHRISPTSRAKTLASQVPAGKIETVPCRLLDDPAARVKMSGMFETKLLIQCGRESELGGVSSNSLARSPLVGTDVQVNDSTGETGPTQTQSETSIALNPDTGTLCSGFNDAYGGVVQGTGYTGFSSSTDGGATFTDYGGLGSSSYGDPSIVWRKSDGKFYFATIHSSGMGLWRSDTDCASFTFVGTPHVGGGDDKELLAVDNNPASPYYGRIYMAWTDFNAGARIFVTYSDNTTSWSTPVAVSGAGVDVQGAWPAVAPNGDVYVSWVRWNPYSAGPIDVEVVRSTNGGTSYTQVTNPLTGGINPYQDAATSACGRPALNGNIRYLPSPQIAVGPEGTLHVVYVRDPDGHGTGDVINSYYKRSTDNGTTWSSEVLLNDDGTTRDQFFPSLSVGPTGRVLTAWYDRRADASNYMFEYYMSISHDGGLTWQPNQLVSDVASPVYLDPGLATCYHGDYDQTTQDAAYGYIQWSDDRNIHSGHNDPDVWFDKEAFASDFTLSVTPPTADICEPGNTSFDVTVGSVLGFTDPVTLIAFGVPAGYNSAFTVNPVVPPGASVLDLTYASDATAGSYPIDVVGVAPTSTHTSTVVLNLFDAVPGAPTLTSPADGATNVPLIPTFEWGAVAQAASYLLEVATDPGFASIVYTATVAATSHTLATNLDPDTTYYWRVSASNTCGGGSYSATFSFTTVLQFCAYPNLAIPDGDPVGVYTDFNSGTGLLITDLDVYIDVTHTWVGDLVFSLEHLDTGTSVTFFDQPGVPASTYGCSGNDIDATLDDEATLPVENECAGSVPTIFGTFTPNNPLSAFDFESMAGTWRLHAYDMAGADVGVVNAWCMVPGLTGAAGTLEGNVTANHDGSPIEGAMVAADDGALNNVYTTYTDFDGDYSFSIPIGTYDVTFSALNYAPATFTDIDVFSATTTTLDAVLEGSLLSFSPPAIEEWMEFGDVVSTTVTITNTGPLSTSFEVLIGDFGGPGGGLSTDLGLAAPISIPASDGTFARGEAAPSLGKPPVVEGKAVNGLKAQASSEALLMKPTIPLGAPAYGIDLLGDSFVSLDTDTPGTLNIISAAAGAFYAGDFFEGDFSTLYTVDNNTFTLFGVDTTTGAMTPVGTMATVGGQTWTGMAGDPTNGTMYAWSTDCSANTLYTIDMGTGAATVVGTTSGVCIIDIAVDAAGEMYGVDILLDQLVAIDKATGAVTPIGLLGFDANYAQGMDFDEDADILYLAAYNNTTGQAQLRIADTTTGNTTLVGNLGAGSGVELDSFGIATGGGGGANWVYPVPASGEIGPNSVTTFEVVFDARNLLQVGDYTASLGFGGTFVNVPPTMPLTMHLSCPSCGFLDGSITDIETGDPVNAQTHITGPNGFDVTQDGDTYSVAVQPGAYHLDVSATGYLSASADVQATTGVTTTTDFALYPAIARLEFSPAGIEETMEIGDVVSNTVTVTNTGYVPMDFTVQIGGYGGPLTLVPISTVPLNPAITADNKATKVGVATGLAQFGTGEVQYPDTPFDQPQAGGNLLLDQQPNQSNGIFSDVSCDLCGGPQVLAENFVLAGTKTIGAINIWSGYFPADTPVPDNITVIFHQDAGGVPGPAVSTETAVPNVRTQTGVILFGVHEYFHEFSLNNPVTLDPGTYWVEIYNDTGFGTDDYFWEAGNLDGVNGLPGSAYAFEAPGALWNIDGATDLAIQLVEGSASGGWASAVPDSGTVPAGSSVTFEVVFDARSMIQTGDFTAELSFTGTFVNVPPIMPLTMHLSCPSCGFLDGSITDAWTSNPLAADVNIMNGAGFDVTFSGVTTYSVAVAPGPYTITVESNGYFSQTAAVGVNAGATTTTDFALVPIVASMEYAPASFEVTVAQGAVATRTLYLSNTGTLPVDFELTDGETGRITTTVETVCPPDAYGYTCIDSNEAGGPTYDFEDISATGTPLILGDDQMSAPVPMGLTFNYYGTDYTDISISSNGFLSVLPGQSSGCCTGGILPSPATPNGVISAWWEDLYPPGAGGSVAYQLLGSAPNRYFVIQFTDIQHYSGGTPVTFQYKLFEGTSNIAIHYMAAPSDGGTHSAGIENQDGTIGLQYYRGSASLTTPLAVCYAPPTSIDPGCRGLQDALWLNESPASGTIPVGDTMMVDIIFDSTAVSDTGTYTATLVFGGSYDNDVPPAMVVMHVVAANPGVALSGDSMDGGLPGTIVTHTFTVTNTGDYTDDIQLAVSGNAWNTWTAASTGELAPGTSTTVDVGVQIPVFMAESVIVGSDTFTLWAQSSLDPQVVTSTTGTTDAIVNPGVALSSDQTQEGEGGTVVTYTFTVTNTGDYTDSFTLAETGIWNVHLETTATGPLGPDESMSFWVEVYIPDGTVGGMDMTTLTATSGWDSGVTASSHANTYAAGGTLYLPILVR